MKKWQSRLAVISVSAILMAIGLALILKTFNDNIVFFYSPSEIPTNVRQPFRVGGLVKAGTVSREGTKMEFVVTDNKADLLVIYDGFPPALFKEGQGAVAFGGLNEKGEFVAEEILAKHDETYTPREVQNSMRK